jgi:hypothetical protein
VTKYAIFKKNSTMTLLRTAFAIFIALLFAGNVSSAQDRSDMNAFIDGLIDKMTLEEKLGQLNLSSGVGDLKVITEGEGQTELRS